MNLLYLCWWVTVGLAGLSLTAMTGLIIRRARQNRRAANDEARRKELKTLAWDLMDNPTRLNEMKEQLRPDDRRLLLKLFREMLEQIRGNYAERFVILMRRLGLMEECIERLRNKAWWIRVDACSTLGYFGEVDSKLALYTALEDPVPEVRVEAARSLARAGAVTSVTELTQYLVTEDASPSMPVVALFRSLGRDAVPELIALLEGDSHQSAKALAIDALGHIGDLQAVPSLLHFYHHPVKTIRIGVMQALSLLRDPGALPAVLLAMSDPDWEVRAQAASCAGYIGANDAIAMLEHLLDDDFWWVRYYAAGALFALGADGIAALKTIARWGEWRAAEIAAGILLEKGQTV
jgi:HEAT repeat protein